MSREKTLADQEFNEQVGKRVTKARLAKGISIAELSRRIGYHDSVVGHWERGFIGMKLTTAMELAKALDVSLDYLAGWDG